MDAKGFFLGLIAAVVLYMLWRKEQGQPGWFSPQANGQAPSSTNGVSSSPGGCSGCSSSSPSAAASPVTQQTTWDVLGMGGQVSPGTPPLQTISGTGSFYGPSGPTPDTTFTNIANTTPLSAAQNVGPAVGNVPGSPTTPATIVPVRATQPTGSFQQIGFQQRYNVVGVPRAYVSNPNATGWVM